MALIFLLSGLVDELLQLFLPVGRFVSSTAAFCRSLESSAWFGVSRLVVIQLSSGGPSCGASTAPSRRRLNAVVARGYDGFRFCWIPHAIGRLWIMSGQLWIKCEPPAMDECQHWAKCDPLR